MTTITHDHAARFFWPKVDKGGGCWLWTAACDRKGYGSFRVRGAGTFRAHRLAYELLVGPIPAGLTLDHLCRNTSCVNPAHLEPVTRSENVRRGGNAIKTHCRHGHPFTLENTYSHPRGERVCLTCRRARDRRRNQTLVAA